MFDISVKILGNQDFFPDHLIETNDMLEILDNEYEGTEKTDQLTAKKAYHSLSHQAMISSHHIQATHQSPNTRSNESVKIEDIEQAVQYWLNKNGKTRCILATV
jgi:hypothetical protein